MDTQQSLHRLSSVFSGKASTDKVQELTGKLGISLPQDTMQAIASLGSNEKISEAIMQSALEMGKSEQEIAAAIG